MGSPRGKQNQLDYGNARNQFAGRHYGGDQEKYTPLLQYSYSNKSVLKDDDEIFNATQLTSFTASWDDRWGEPFRKKRNGEDQDYTHAGGPWTSTAYDHPLKQEKNFQDIDKSTYTSGWGVKSGHALNSGWTFEKTKVPGDAGTGGGRNRLNSDDGKGWNTARKYGAGTLDPYQNRYWTN